MREITEEQKEKIKKEAREILDKFSNVLRKVNIKIKKEESFLGGFRKESSGTNANKDFRRIIFKNAPNKEGNAIIAEKKKW